MILAAGRGARLRPLTDTCPKPLLQLGPLRLIEYHLLALKRAKVDTVVINVSWLAGQIIDALGEGSDYGLKIVYSIEEQQALETAGGIAKALPLLGSEVFWVVNADIFTDFDFSWTPEHLSPRDDARLLLTKNPPQNPRGDFSCVEGRLGRQNLEHESFTYCGIGLYRPEFFKGVPHAPTSLAPMLFGSADRETLAGEVYTGVWDDIGTEARLNARRRLQEPQ